MALCSVNIRNIKVIYYAILCIYLISKRVYSATEEVVGGEEKISDTFQVVRFNFEHVSDVYAITLWILLGSLAKVGFHLSHKLTEKFPESCLLIILGLVVGTLLYATKLAEQKAYVLNSDTFFLFLLPPIIFEAGYFMPNRPFFDNIGTILVFAIANTFFNTITIGLTLWAFSFTPIYGGTEFEMLHCFVFSALISAVDPVAVLATFVEIHVNDMLYIVVFGESLLNDAVSVVLYRMFDSFADMAPESIGALNITLGGVSFLYVAFGGVLTGIIFGILACFTTKFTEHTPVLEPLIILTYSYLSYLTAEMFSTSGILAITFCGMFMKQYIEFNISKKSNATIEYVLKMLASIMETIIFMFMGLSTISDHHSWNTGFVCVTLISCSFYRIIGVLIFANIANRWRLLELKLTDMLIMSYGGIRGAVAFALALILDESKIPRKKEFVTATIAVVFFTVFVQGTTIGPIVKYFKIKRKEIEEPTMSAKLTNRLIDHIMSCLEDIAGVNGKHSLRDKIRNFDRFYIKPFLLREKFLSRDEKLLSTFKKITESNFNKMAENPELLFQSTQSMAQLNSLVNNRNMSLGNLISNGIPEIATVPDFQVLDAVASKRVTEDAQYHHLLDNAMYDVRRTQKIHKRSQLDEEENPYERSRRAVRKYGIATLHHQKPVNLRSMIETDRKSLGGKKRSQSNFGQTSKSSSGERTSRPKTKSAEPRPINDQMKEKFFIVTDENCDSGKITRIIAPASPDTNIPPPWKNAGSSDDEPVKAEMPTWANNPDYTLHATT
ncbi:putative Na(+) H(+) antiporter nhx-9 isoform X1, partial [Brachionus plicatilis]